MNESIEPPPALVLGCNTPHGIGALSDWIEEQTGHAPDFTTPSAPTSTHDEHTRHIGNGYEHGYGGCDGIGEGCGYVDGNGHGDGEDYGDGCGDGHGDGRGFVNVYGHDSGDGEGAGTEMQGPDEEYDDYDFDGDGRRPETCWHCHGDGGFHECGDDTCACANPELNEVCDECGGSGRL